MSRQSWQELIGWATSDGAAVANTATETVIYPDITLPGGYQNDGRVLRLTVFGKLSTTGTPTMTFALRWGGVAGTLLATSEAITNGSGVTNVSWGVQLTLQVRSNGSSGSILAVGAAEIHTAAGTLVRGLMGVSGYDAPAPVTVDLSTDQALSITAKWGTANASNTLTGLLWLLESLN